jgi:hypothetical protein
LDLWYNGGKERERKMLITLDKDLKPWLFADKNKLARYPALHGIYFDKEGYMVVADEVRMLVVKTKLEKTGEETELESVIIPAEWIKNVYKNVGKSFSNVLISVDSKNKVASFEVINGKMSVDLILDKHYDWRYIIDTNASIISNFPMVWTPSLVQFSEAASALNIRVPRIIAVIGKTVKPDSAAMIYGEEESKGFAIIMNYIVSNSQEIPKYIQAWVKEKEDEN